MKVVLDEGAYMPEKAHRADAGYDIRTPEEFDIFGHSFKTIDTGVHVQIPAGYVGFLKSKSGLNIANSITGEGVIDAGYTGSIRVKLYCNDYYGKHFDRGDKIIQLVILPIYTPALELSDNLEDTERGNNGFGSTGRRYRMKMHRLKILEQFADDIVAGDKLFEIRKNDRGFQKGDHVCFTAVNNSTGEEIVHEICKRRYEITYVLSGWGLKNGYVVLGLREV